MTDAEWCQMAGQLESDLDLDRLAAQLSGSGLRVRLRESSHFEGGRYLRVEEGADFTLERVGSTEYLARADASSLEQLLRAASTVSLALAGLDVRHRFEVYDPASRLAHFLHHRWPRSDDAEAT